MMGMVEEFEKGIATLKTQGPALQRFITAMDQLQAETENRAHGAIDALNPVVEELVGLGTRLATILAQAREQRLRLDAAHAALSLGRVDEAMNELEAALGAGVVP